LRLPCCRPLDASRKGNRRKRTAGLFGGTALFRLRRRTGDRHIAWTPTRGKAPTRGRSVALRNDWFWRGAGTRAPDVGPHANCWLRRITAANLEGVFTALIAWIVFREPFNRHIGLGMASILVGAVLLALATPSGQRAAPGSHSLMIRDATRHEKETCHARSPRLVSLKREVKPCPGWVFLSDANG
jgi:hypothetical protein